MKPRAAPRGLGALTAPAAAAAVTLAVVLVGCGDTGSNPSGPESAAFAVIVSEPVQASPAGSPPAAGRLGGALRDSVAYVSLLPGTVPGGVTVTIGNRATGETRTAPMVDGGLDPVPVPAAVGDTLEVTVRDGTGVVGRVIVVVAVRRPPIVVRTDPPPKKTDVPLNVVIIVVFSEPIDSATITAANLRLSADTQAVGALVTLVGQGLRAEIRPDTPLAPQTEYTLVITTGVADLAGDRLENSVQVTFTTLPGGGDRIAFVSDRTPADIYVMNPDGSEVVNLTNHPWSDHGPAWSPDGSRIAFVSDRDGACNSLYVMNTDGSGVTRLTSGPVCDYAYTPSWSPDGSKVAFERWSGGSSSDIYIVNADGSGLVRLTSGGAFHEQPAWSPDGSRIAFVRYGAGSLQDIYVMNADGTGVTNITNHPLHDVGPAWSPDGSRIAFATTRDGNTEIYLMNPDGSGLANLTNSPARELGVAWSPDGSKLAFDSNRDGNLEIYVMNADGTDVVRLTTHPAYDESPAWARR